jgi:hypothetical protein
MRRERLSSNTFERSVALAAAASDGSCELMTDARALSTVLGVMAPETADKSVWAAVVDLALGGPMT